MPRRDLFDQTGALVRSEHWDAITFTATDRNGAVIESRSTTAREIDSAQAETVDATAATIRAQLINALLNNRSFIATTGPTNAQVVAQVKALSLQNNRMIRLLMGLLDDTN